MNKISIKMINRIVVLAVLVLSIGVALFGCDNKTPEGDYSVSEAGLSDNAVSDNLAVSENDILPEIETPESILLDDYMETLATNYDYIQSMNGASAPSALSVEVANGISKDIFFANGTPIRVLSYRYNLDDYEWDETLQKQLGNGLDQENKGFGAVVTWDEGSKTKYVFVSNMVEIYGGSYKEDLHSDISITVDGENNWNAYPNISFLYGGCWESDLVGDVNITINQARPMFMVGGGHNGSVFGNINVSYDKNSWSLDIIGGGLADAENADELAICYGDISVSINTAECTSDSNSLIGGGLAITKGEYTAVSDVIGNIDINVAGQSFKEICAGGVAVRIDESAEMPVSNVFGSTSMNAVKSKVLRDGLLSESGLGKDGLALVFGDRTIIKDRLTIDRKSQGEVDHYYTLDKEKYFGSPITNAYEAINKADRCLDKAPTTSEVLENAARIGFEQGEIIYAINVYKDGGEYMLSLYNYKNNTFTTKSVDEYEKYMDVLDVKGINKRYKEYQLAILEGNIGNYMEEKDDIILYTADTYNEEKAKDYTTIYPDFEPYLQWNGKE